MSATPFNTNSASIGECESTIIPPTPIAAGTPIVKVPVVLQELSVQIPMHARITFPVGQRVLEVKTIKKRTKVTQCRLIQPRNVITGQPARFKLYLAGFVRKNIQYAANPAVDGDQEILSAINSLTVDVPFECVVSLNPADFLNQPI
jgi:hypothetical protein